MSDSGDAAALPVIIQGGMGVGVSTWRLARAVSSCGQLGVVSGTAIDQILARRLQDGDPGGDMRRALDRFPCQAMAARVRDGFFIRGGKAAAAAYRTLPLWSREPARELLELCVVANFAEVWLAKEGHRHPVGINYLEKIQLPHLPSLFGAMLAGVDYVLMGAGIPLKIPGVLDAFARLEPAHYPLHVTGALPEDDNTMTFVPRDFTTSVNTSLKRPRFLAIVASNTLAATMMRRANGRVDGLVVEGPTAGGHNAPPRGKLTLNEHGAPVYGDRDRVDLEALRGLGVPFWLAGGYGDPAAVRAAVTAGAAGVQVGTAFAFCAESGLRDDLKHAICASVRRHDVRVLTDALASPTGFPFKVVQAAGTIAEPGVYEARARICDLGYLREAYRRADGSIDYRCPAEPINVYVSKGGERSETVGRKCICNALVATGGHPQMRAGRHVEAPIVTSGDDLPGIERFMPAGAAAYRAADVVETLLAR